MLKSENLASTRKFLRSSQFDNQSFTFDTATVDQLALLCGQFNKNLQQIENRMDVRISQRGNAFSVTGEILSVKAAVAVLEFLYSELQRGFAVSPDSVHLAIQHHLPLDESANDVGALPNSPNVKNSNVENFAAIRTKKCTVKPRGKNQQHYVGSVLSHDVNFGIGPAGTGKTYLAVACAVQALMRDEIEKIILVRPAVEAGEKLGFLPGDLSQKVDPYLRPLYDALYDMLGSETVDKFVERSVIEVAPLAYMRGRTLSGAFVILDESQNTTREQMKMFLTRIGFGTTAVINGDPTQIDLPRGAHSGLAHAEKILKGVEGVSFTYFSSKDVVRHPIVQRIIEAYERHSE